MQAEAAPDRREARPGPFAIIDGEEGFGKAVGVERLEKERQEDEAVVDVPQRLERNEIELQERALAQEGVFVAPRQETVEVIDRALILREQPGLEAHPGMPAERQREVLRQLRDGAAPESTALPPGIDGRDDGEDGARVRDQVAPVTLKAIGQKGGGRQMEQALSS